MRRSWLRRAQARTVVVHMRDNSPSVRGVLSGTFTDGIELRHAELLNDKSGSPATSIAGEAFVPRDRIALVQTADGQLALTA